MCSYDIVNSISRNFQVWVRARVVEWNEKMPNTIAQYRFIATVKLYYMGNISERVY